MWSRSVCGWLVLTGRHTRAHRQLHSCLRRREVHGQTPPQRVVRSSVRQRTGYVGMQLLQETAPNASCHRDCGFGHRVWRGLSGRSLQVAEVHRGPQRTAQEVVS